MFAYLSKKIAIPNNLRIDSIGKLSRENDKEFDILKGGAQIKG